MESTPAIIDAIIISCDIVGHGLEPDLARQVDRIRGLNDAIRVSLARFPAPRIVWASGGDGGHVAFLDPGILSEALDLVQRLRQWAEIAGVLLRVTCHRGPVSTVTGADGRLQLVGEAINLCGSLVAFGDARRVIATSDFRDYLESDRSNTRSGPELRFKDRRVVYLKHFNVRTVWILEFPGEVQQPWEVERSDHRQLREAAQSGNPWQLIYHTKRLLQVDSADPHARDALVAVHPGSLSHGHPPKTNPLLGVLPRAALAKLLQASELVERDDGDIICRRGDSGDSMFIVLKGEIGVVTRPPQEDSTQSEPFDIRIEAGGIVGELALALNRPRTATLQSVGETALLAINRESLDKLQHKEGRNSRLSTSFNHFLEERIVEHLCRHAPYLQLGYTHEQKRLDPEPWDRIVDGVRSIVIEAEKAEPQLLTDLAQRGETGLYLLANGRLVEASETHAVPKVLSGEGFDIVFARLPGSVIDVGHHFKVDTGSGVRRLTMIHISDAALREYARDRFQTLVQQIRYRLALQMVFDVFISYTSENTDLAVRWKAAFQDAGLSVYMNSPSAMAQFEPEIDLALAESRVLVPIISRATLKSDWVSREIDKRKLIFDERHANILPIETEPRLAERMAVGFTPIVAGQNGSAEERDAMQRAAATIGSVVKGGQPPPFRTLPRE